MCVFVLIGDKIIEGNKIFMVIIIKMNDFGNFVIFLVDLLMLKIKRNILFYLW